MKKFGLGVLAASLVFSVPAGVLADRSHGEMGDRTSSHLAFKDTGSDYWANESIDRMRVKDIFKGYDDNTFRPSKPVTRMQTIVTAVRMLGLEEEAQSKDSNTSVPFKDAEDYFGNERNEWAKGYVLVALEQGLFESHERVLAPNKPAKRIWVAKTLIHALGLEDEARKAMTEEPSFRDSEAIPAGAVGYANIADEYDIMTGNNENKFLPHKPITRAQMATVLDRTYDNLLEEQGGTALQGTLVSLDDRKQTLTVVTSDGTNKTYSYKDDFYVSKYYNDFVPVSDLQDGDVLSLQILDDVIEDASVLSSEASKEAEDTNIYDAKVEVEYSNDDEFELEYSIKRGRIDAEIEEKQNGVEDERKGEEAKSQVQQYIDDWQLESSMSKEEIVRTVIQSLERQDGMEEIEIDITFTNGVRVKHEKERLDDEYDKNNDDNGHDENNDTNVVSDVESFELKADWFNGNKEEWSYELEEDGVEAEVEREVRGRESELTYKEAVSFVEERLQDMDLSSDQSEQDILDQLLMSEGWEQDEIEEFELEITFQNDVEKELEWSHEDDDDDE